MRDAILIYASVMLGWRSRTLITLWRERREKGQRLSPKMWLGLGVTSALVAALAVVVAR